MAGYNDSELEEEILANLRAATDHWKETGDTGESFKVPVTMRDRIYSLLSELSSRLPSIRRKSSAGEDLSIPDKLPLKFDMAKEAESVIKEEHSFAVDAFSEWRKLAEKMDAETERKEFDDLYNELNNKII